MSKDFNFSFFLPRIKGFPKFSFAFTDFHTLLSAIKIFSLQIHKRFQFVPHSTLHKTEESSQKKTNFVKHEETEESF